MVAGTDNWSAGTPASRIISSSQSQNQAGSSPHIMLSHTKHSTSCTACLIAPMTLAATQVCDHVRMPDQAAGTCRLNLGATNRQVLKLALGHSEYAGMPLDKGQSVGIMHIIAKLSDHHLTGVPASVVCRRHEQGCLTSLAVLLLN